MCSAMKGKKRIIFIVTIAIIIMASIVAFAIWRIQASYQAVERSTQNAKGDTRQYSKDERQLLREEINTLIGKGDYKEAIRLIEAQNNINDNDMQAVLAGAYANSGDYKKSLEIYKRLESE